MNATITTATAILSNNAETTPTSPEFSNSSTILPPTKYAQLNSFNSSVKTFFNKTIAKVATTNLSDYTAQYSLPPLISSDGAAATAADVAATLMPPTRHIASSTFPTQTVATFIAGNKNRATTIIVYPTVSPESIVIPIVSCIFGFPILALIVICCLRRRAKLARERDRRRNYDMQDHAVSLVRFSPIHRLNYRSSRAISLRPERSMSQGFTSLELDTVMEERCSDIEQTQTEIINAESPMESISYKASFSS
ncbi:uncharacterized protein LOC119669988 [Teleopsis dalmanni]|uniref:uncharacterized protein LOC119669988 n=1 Tax=Teleopsis dalmanni TaxID=139649 RepID=UPI0018CD7FD1|nr:uncharacterized protein LOC119669988 [Teleopsis dalmanni]